MLWIAATDEFHTTTLNGSHNVVNTKSLVSFLAGFYYKFIRSSNERSPLIIDINTPQLPENLLKLAEIENISSLLIAPALHDKQIKGTLILGTDNKAIFANINQDLLQLLINLSLTLNSNHSSLQFKNPENSGRLFGMMVGKSRQIQDIYKRIIQLSLSDANVLIQGESGTGKELIARTIHNNSLRKNTKFIPLDCVAMSSGLLERELFGYEKGAFPGINHEKAGLMENSSKATLFFDEITGLDMKLQSKLLRVLQEQQFQRIGGSQVFDVKVRIISATNVNPQEAIRKSELREDLFYRLNVIPIKVPPLRERKEDIPLLIEHFKQTFLKSHKNVVFPDAVMYQLVHYPWPGNVRELKNIIERLLALAQNSAIRVEDLPAEIRTSNRVPKYEESDFFKTQPYNLAKERNLMEFERNYFSRLLDKCSGNITKVAIEAKVSRKTIYNILHKHGLNTYQFVIGNVGGTKHPLNP